MSIQLNVDYSHVNVCVIVNKGQDQIQIMNILQEFHQIRILDQIAFCKTFDHQNFLSFLQRDTLNTCQNILQGNLKQEVTVSGFGAQDQKHFEDFLAIVTKHTNLTLVKQRGVINSLRVLEFLIKNNIQWFFNFSNLINVTELHNIKKGLQIDKNIQIKSPEYPFIFLNLNKNVSFYRVDSATSIKKLSGSIIGDSTVEGIIQLLGYKQDLNEIFRQAFEIGDSTQVDLSVGDIYGDKVDFPLPKDLIASTMGKAQFKKQDEINSINVVKSLWNMLAINLGMISYLHSEIEKIQRVVCNSAKLTFEPFLFTLQVIMNNFSQGKLDAYFIENGEYLSILQ